MLFPINYKPELCASNDETRPHICEVYLDAEKGKLCATNGHVLVRLPVETSQDPDKPDVTGFVSRDALAVARKNGGQLECSSELKTANGQAFPRPSKGEVFPPYQKVIPAPKETDIKVGLNPQYLWDMARALGWEKKTHKCMVLHIDPTDPLSPVRVTLGDSDPAGETDALGVIMTMRF